MSSTDEEALESADAAFTGALVKVITPPGDMFSSSDSERFVFEVDEVFKGTVFSCQSIVTARSGASCGLEIIGPGPYLVFATEDDRLVRGAVDGELYSNLCSGTRALTSEAPPAGFEATSPLPGASAVGGGGSGTGTALVRAAVLVVRVALVGGGCVFGVRRLRRTRCSAPC